MVNDGKNMAGMVSEKVQACGDGFCDRAAREQAKMKAAIYERLRAADEVRVPPGAPMLGLDAVAAKNPLCLPGCGVETPKNRCVHEFGCIVAAQENRKARNAMLGSAAGRLDVAQKLTEAGAIGDARSLDAVLNPPRYGLAQQTKAQGKQFTRSDILAILRGLSAEFSAQGIHSAGLLALDRARNIFENLE